jgi:hypothetical protein
MDEGSDRQRSAATPQYSPDGRWWWDGQEWWPASAPGSPRASPSQAIRPRRRLYLVALLAAVAAVVLLVAASVFSGFPGNATRVIVPGKAKITLAEPGTYTISYEHQTAGDGGGSARPEVASMLLELAPADSATRVPIRSLPGDFTSTEGSTEDVAIDEFRIDHPGSYSLVSRYSSGQTGRPVVLAIARGSTANSGLVIIAFLAAIILLLAGLGLGAVTLVLRIRASWRRRRASAPMVSDARRPAARVDPADPVTIRRALDRLGALSQRLPHEPRAKVAEIIGEIVELIPQTGLFPPGSRDLFVLQRTATEYLPTSVDAYLALPASYATTAVLRDGRTALQILGDQLDLLDVEVGEIGHAVRHRDSERLLVHGRFLEQVFGRGSNELELPPSE